MHKNNQMQRQGKLLGAQNPLVGVRGDAPWSWRLFSALELQNCQH